MTTRLELRSTLRRRLEDTTVSPLWDDVTLNEALWNSLIRLGVRIPKEATVSVPIVAGQTSIPVMPTLPYERVLRVFDGDGYLVPESVSAGDSGIGAKTTWRWWNGSLVLSRALGSPATWSIEYRATPTMPVDDVSPVDIAIEDEPILVAMAAESVLRIRAVEEMKRMGNSRVPTNMAELAMAEAVRLIQDRKRRVRSGFLQAAN